MTSATKVTGRARQVSRGCATVDGPPSDSGGGAGGPKDRGTAESWGEGSPGGGSHALTRGVVEPWFTHSLPSSGLWWGQPLPPAQ